MSEIVERIEQIKKERVESGETVVTPGITFEFPFLRDERFLSSPQKDALLNFAGSQSTIPPSKEAVADLRLKKPLTIIRTIPEDNERQYIIPSIGIGGVAFSGNEVKLYFDPSHDNVVESLSKLGERQIAHEINHVARFQAGKMDNSLLDAMISEGLATYHEEYWRGKYLETRWGHALNPDQLIEEWEKAKKELTSSEYNYRDWFFGIDKGHPVWTGYSLGTAIVSDYFKKHPQAGMVEVVRVPSKKILKESGFSPI